MHNNTGSQKKHASPHTLYAYVYRETRDLLSKPTATVKVYVWVFAQYVTFALGLPIFVIMVVKLIKNVPVKHFTFFIIKDKS